MAPGKNHGKAGPNNGADMNFEKKLRTADRSGSYGAMGSQAVSWVRALGLAGLPAPDELQSSSTGVQGYFHFTDFKSPPFISPLVRLLASCFMILLAVPVWGKSPVLRALEPRGAQQGKAFTLTLKGEYLKPAAEVITSIPGSVSRLAPSPDLPVPESELPFLVQLREDASVGLYPIRIRTEEGFSNVLLFSVGKFPEVVETESVLKGFAGREFEQENNNSPAKAQKVTPPVTINGTLEGPDQDYYSFRAKAAERLVFEVAARRVGSAIDPVIRVLDKSGRELASNDDAPGLGVDARVEVLFPKAGDYYVVVHDAKYSIQKENFYRLTIGSYPYAEGIFPLGWQRGGTVEVTLVGGNLKAPVKVKPGLAVSASEQFVAVSLPGGASLPFPFRVSDLPEIIEPGEAETAKNEPGCSPACPLPPSTVVNGRISRPGEIDKYRLSVSSGEHWVIHLEAANLGTSQLLGQVSVFDAETNKRLAQPEVGEEDSKEAVPSGMPKELDPHISFTVPGNVHEVVVAVRDVLGRGGPNYGYRLLASRQPLDFSLQVLTPFVNIARNGTAAIEVAVRRRGYKGPIRLSIPNLPDDIVAEGGNIPAEPFPPQNPNPGYVTLTANPGTKPRSFELAVWGEAISGETPFRTQARAPGMITAIEGTDEQPFTAPWLGQAVPVTLMKPSPVSLEVPQRRFRLPQGVRIKIPWKLLKDSQMQAPFEVKMRGAYPCGATFLRDLHAMPKPGGPEHPYEGVFDVIAGLATPAVTFDFVLEAILHDEGGADRIVTAPAITIEIAPLYALKLFAERFEIKRGGKFELSGAVQREPGFTGIIKVGVEGLPEHVIGSEIAIPSNQDNFRLVFQADPEAKPGEFEIHLTSSATIPGKEGQDYRIPELKARLRILPPG